MSGAVSVRGSGGGEEERDARPDHAWPRSHGNEFGFYSNSNRKVYKQGYDHYDLLLRKITGAAV